MNLSLENPQNHPPETVLLRAPTQRPGIPSLASFIIFCLHFLGCDIENISHVLEAYDVDNTIINIANYIEQEQMVRFDEITTPQRTCARSSDPVVTVKYVRGMPERLEVKGPRELTSSPRGIVTAVTADGQKITTMAVGRRFRCRAGGSSGPGSSTPQ